MKNKHKNNPKLVYSLVGPAYMKFIPQSRKQKHQQTTALTFVDRLKSVFNVAPWKNQPNLFPQQSISSNKEVREKQPISSSQSIKYVCRLTNEDILIGNEYHLDAMFVGGVLEDYIDTCYLWSINSQAAIVDVAVDQQKNLILLLTQNQLTVYQFNSKGMQQKPAIVASLTYQKQLKFVKIFKGIFLLCGVEGIAAYELEEQKYELKHKVYRSYNSDISQFGIFQVPESLENNLKIFFKEKQTNVHMISFWVLAVEVNEKQIKMGKMAKIRDVPAKLEGTVNFSNYSSSIYFMQIEQNLLAMRGAYVLDTLKTTKIVQNTHYKLFEQKKLVHLSEIKMEIYSLDLDESKNPPKIQVKSLDSLLLPAFKFKTRYIDIINILGNNFLIAFQNASENNRYKKGEIRYAFVLTTQLKIEQKLVGVIPQQFKDLNFQKIQEKADIAQKMGLPQKDVYLKIWNNSQKSTVEDFKLLMDTLSYPTIREEIDKKLKKNSMSFRQVLLLQQGCMSMLHNEVSGSNCTSQTIKNYFISHLLTRKLYLYRRFSQVQKQQKKVISEDESGKLLITIQDYNFLKNVDVGTLLVQLILRYCNEDKDEILKIRWLIKIFRFQLRTVYQNLLTQIITSTKKKLIKILQTVPELLPYEPQLDSNLLQDATLYQGIWNNLNDIEWQKCFYLDNVEKIQNRECLAQFCQSVWFRRFWFSQHDFINLKRHQIEQIHMRNKSNFTFFYIIEAIFDNITQPDALRQIIDFVQDRYSSFPQHIYGKVFLYRNLFEIFGINNRVHKIAAQKIQKFSQFLHLEDCEIFKAMFNYQKIKKGFIMKQMKPLYYQLSGPEAFHEGLLNYFASDLSEVSDIKHLLNRMNNEKKEFHMQNQSIYQVIVRAMQLKLKIGSAKDIPLQEVIIYIQTIPLSQNNPVLKDLQIMRIINEQSMRLRTSHLDMSIFEITKNSNKVFMSLIYFEFQSRKIDDIYNVKELKELSHKILGDLLILHAKIYSETDIKSILFIYLTRLMQNIEHFQIVKQLLGDTWINKHFNCDAILAQNLVLYMRKWILHKVKTYDKAENFLRKLLGFLEEKVTSRLYIQAELQLALLLSTETKPVAYPLCKFNTYLTMMEIQALIQNIPVDQLLKLEPERLFLNMEAMQYWGSDCQLKQQKLENLYQILVVHFIVCGKIKEAVSMLKDLLNLKANSPYNFVYHAMIVSKISVDLTEQNRKILLQCCSYLFSKSKELLDFIDELINKAQTNQQQKLYLANKLATFKATNIAFSKQNVLFQSKFIGELKTSELDEKYSELLRDFFFRLKKDNQQFTKPQYQLLFIMLCHKPEVFIKYIYLVRNQINFKRVRFMISYVSQCPLFNKDFVLEFGVRLFTSILSSTRSGFNIQMVIAYIFIQKLGQSSEVPGYVPQNALDYKLMRSIEKMKEKKDHIMKQSKLKKPQIHKGIFITNLEQYIKCKSQFVYDYPDTDDNEFTTIRSALTKQQPKKSYLQFDEEFNLLFLSSRSTKIVMPYLSVEKQRDYRNTYYHQKEEREFIYNQLSLDRPKETTAANNQLNDRIRNSNRISRSQTPSTIKPANIQPPSEETNQLLRIVIPYYIEDEPIEQEHELLNISRQVQGYRIKEQSPRYQQAKEQSPYYQQPKKQSPKQLEIKEYSPYYQQIVLQEQEIERNVMLETDSKVKRNPENVVLDQYKIDVLLSKEKDEQKIRESAFKKQKSALLSQEQITTITQNYEEKITKGQNIDFSALQKQCESNRMASLLQSIIKQSFLSQYDFSTSLKLASAIQSYNPSLLALNQKSLQIYKKSLQLQQKFSLDLPLKKVFISEGLFLKDKKLEPLFQILVGNMYQYLSEDQLMKMCKVVTIAFKKPSLQHEIIFGYLLQLIQSMQSSNLSQSKKILEKVLGYIRKLPPKYLKKRDGLFVRNIRDEKMRQRIVSEIVEWSMQRDDEPTAQYFQRKYLSFDV